MVVIDINYSLGEREIRELYRIADKNCVDLYTFNEFIEAVEKENFIN